MATQAAFPVRSNVMNSMFDRELEERLVRYVRIDTQSDEKSADVAQHRASSTTCSGCWWRS